MATKVPPNAAASLLATSDAASDAFRKYTDSYISGLKAKQAQLNNSGSPDPKQTKQAVYSKGTFFPASEDRFIVGRGTTKWPQAVVVCRAGPSTSSKEASQVFSLVQRFTSPASTPAGAVTPHFLVGYTGEVVQFADVSDTCRFLRGEATAPTLLSQGDLEDQIIDSVIAFTVTHEAGADGYYAFNPNDRSLSGVSSGIAFGFIQFNQKLGTLSDLLQEMFRQDETKFREIFTTIADKLIDASWVRKASLSSYESQFRAAGRHAPFQLAQRLLARRIYWPLATQAARTLGVQSQRAHAILFDAAVQRTPKFVNVAKLAAAGATEEIDKLRKIAVALDSVDDNGNKWVPAYTRRTSLFRESRLSDVPLLQSLPITPGPSKYSDENVVVVMLEGRTDDPITSTQRDAVAAVIRSLSEKLPQKFQIGNGTIVGADMLGLKEFAADTNPGASFGYGDLFSAVKVSKVSDFVAQNADVVFLETVLASLGTYLVRARQQSSLQSLALLQAYESATTAVRTAKYNTSREAIADAAVAEVQQKVAAAASAGPIINIQAASGPAPSKPPEGTTKGILYDFATGLWSDGQVGGKIV